MDIQRITNSNLEDVIKLVTDVFMEFEAPDYSDTGIKVFFVDGEYHRQGIGRKLFETVLRNSSNELTVNSSPYAKEIYHHLGFIDTNTEQVYLSIKKWSNYYFKKGPLLFLINPCHGFFITMADLS